ncbi:MAG TPA: hypothetical protein P5228_05400 [Bacteroidales bacterium]|nr:hypothetical protein [Bacteroidales bacterium]HRZ47782.1 hypothetical protein [Bacteroidales bacterium]
MKKIIILAVILVMSRGMYAQHAGYMGKHFILSGEASVNVKVNWDVFDLELRHNDGLHFEALLGPQFGLGVGYKRRHSASSIDIYDDYFVYPDYTISSTTYSLDFYIYRREGIMPLGRFVRISVLGFRNKTTDFFDGKVANAGIDPNSFPGYDQYTIANTNLGLGLSFGYRRIIANHIVVTAATHLGYCLGNPFTLDFEDFYSKSILDQKFRFASYKENVGMNLIALNVSVGGIF